MRTTAAAPDNEDCAARGDEGGKQEERLRSGVMQPIVRGGGAQREVKRGEAESAGTATGSTVDVV